VALFNQHDIQISVTVEVGKQHSASALAGAADVSVWKVLIITAASADPTPPSASTTSSLLSLLTSPTAPEGRRATGRSVSRPLRGERAITAPRKILIYPRC